MRPSERPRLVLQSDALGVAWGTLPVAGCQEIGLFLKWAALVCTVWRVIAHGSLWAWPGAVSVYSA